MEKVYLVIWSNGEQYDYQEINKGVFSTMEKAQSYVDKWRDDYKKDSDEIAIKLNYHEMDDYDFDWYFPESMSIKEYDLQ